MLNSEAHFAAEQQSHDQNYRPLCGLALVALVLGLLSPLAVYSPYFLLAPLLSAVFSILALRRIRLSGGELSGRRLAIAGFAAAAFFGSWGTAHNLGRSWFISYQARKFCDGWLQLLIDGQISEAYQWTVVPESRIAPSISLDDFYARSEEARSERDIYLGGLPFRTDAQKTALQSYHYLNNASIAKSEMGEDLIVHRYQIVYEKDGQTKTETLLLTVGRQVAEDSPFVLWQLRDKRLASGNAE